MAGTCLPVERMYITMATLTMAEICIKTNSIGLQLKAKCWYGQEEIPQA